MPLVLDGSSGISNGGLTGFTIDTAGRVRFPNQPAFWAALSGGWSHPSGVALVLGTWITSFNIGSCYNITTRRFTAPISGVYQLNATIATSGGAGTFSYLSCEFWVNGARRVVGGWDGGGPSYGQTSHSTVLFLNTNDYVQIGCESNKTFNLDASNNHTTFSGFLVG
jgi:hypothetical protein